MFKIAFDAMTGTIDWIPIVDRIMAIFNASEKGVPLAKSEASFVLDPTFLAEFSTSQWTQHNVALHNAADAEVSDGTDS